MRRTILILSLGLGLISGPALATDDSYRPDWTLALKGGVWIPDIPNVGAGPVFGAELAVNDPLIAVPVGRLRHMLSFNHADHDGLRQDSLELNAHWQFETRRDFWIGFGPGLGYVWNDGHGLNDGGSVQWGLSASHEVGHTVIGIESRYQWVEGGSANNWQTMVKLGYRF